jgi:hypothetical protein
MKNLNCPGGKCKLLCPLGCGAHALLERKCSPKVIETVRAGKTCVVEIKLKDNSTAKTVEEFSKALQSKLKLSMLDEVYVGRLSPQAIKCLTNSLFVGNIAEK